MKRMITLLAVLSLAAGHAAAGQPTSDKTLISWVCLANTTQQGGSALTIQSGTQFDAIVFGGSAAAWPAASAAISMSFAIRRIETPPIY